MKRAFFLTAAALAAALTFNATLTTARACQYCRMAMEDPEAARMVTDNRGGSFPLDGAISQYQAAPAPAELKVAPAASSIVTSASALTAPAPAGTVAPVVVHRPVLLPPVVPVAIVAVAKAPAKISAPVAAQQPASAVNTAIAHWMDACLLGLVAAGGVFCWRTRRPSQDEAGK